ncbi:MAG TPA: fluoride efflux transporter CrcB [Nitrolancea sp.]|nr:fluoride efflux transporter CrcB [Nitrolancea sp.]
MVYLWLALGGALGTISRYTVSGWVAARYPSFPWGTFTVNIAGALVIGFFLTLAEERFLIAPEARVFVATGFLGGFTTFSTFSWETMALLRDGAFAPALGNAAGSLLTGLFAVYLGIVLARLV